MKLTKTWAGPVIPLTSARHRSLAKNIGFIDSGLGCWRPLQERYLRSASLITAFKYISQQRAWITKIRRNRSDAHGFSTRTNIACPQDISICMNLIGQIARFALSLITHPGWALPMGSYLISISRIACR